MKTLLFLQNYSLAELDGKISAVKAALMKKSNEFQSAEFSYWHMQFCFLCFVFFLSRNEFIFLVLCRTVVIPHFRERVRKYVIYKMLLLFCFFYTYVVVFLLYITYVNKCASDLMVFFLCIFPSAYSNSQVFLLFFGKCIHLLNVQCIGSQDLLLWLLKPLNHYLKELNIKV